MRAIRSTSPPRERPSASAGADDLRTLCSAAAGARSPDSRLGMLGPSEWPDDASSPTFLERDMSSCSDTSCIVAPLRAIASTYRGEASTMAGRGTASNRRAESPISRTAIRHRSAACDSSRRVSGCGGCPCSAARNLALGASVRQTRGNETSAITACRGVLASPRRRAPQSARYPFRASLRLR